jgi:hypothetical protein
MKKSALFTMLLIAVLLVMLGGSCSLTEKKDNSVSTENTDDEETIEMATTDVFGEDLTDIPRYPSSIRTYYAQDEEETAVTYETQDSETKVRDFYKTTLIEKGWKQVGIATDYIDFEKGDEENPEILTVYFTLYEEEQILEYELVYSPPLTEEELAELESEE